MKHLIVSFISPDRPGLVDSLSDVVAKYKGNWQISSMHQLSGFFTGVLQIAVVEDKAESLINEIKAIPQLEALLKLVSEPVKQTIQPNLVLELTANDRSGIVQEISSVIHQQGGNLLKLVSTKESAAHSGQNLFKAKASVAVNDNDTQALIDALENLADDLMVDISQ